MGFRLSDIICVMLSNLVLRRWLERSHFEFGTLKTKMSFINNIPNDLLHAKFASNDAV